MLLKDQLILISPISRTSELSQEIFDKIDTPLQRLSNENLAILNSLTEGQWDSVRALITNLDAILTDYQSLVGTAERLSNQ